MNAILSLKAGAAALAVSVGFAITGLAQAAPQDGRRGGDQLIVNCSSGDYDMRYCVLPTDGRVLDARVHRRLSQADCDREEDWGIRGDRLWVSNGCRAEFEVRLASGRSADWPDEGLAGGPGYRGHRDHGDYGRERAPDFQLVQERCSHAAIEEAWRAGFYSAQYHNGPRLVEGYRGYELRGQVRLHNRKGFHYRESVCEFRRGEVTSFSYLR